MKISACIITKNEEANIGRCIRSFVGIADETIVVDSESDDRTQAIAGELGASVYTRPWTGDFAAAKNFAIGKAAGDWIIFLDADEYFEAGGAKRAKELMQLADKDKRIDAVSVNMKHFADEQGTVLTVHPIVRIFKNFRGICYESKIHEYLMKDGKKLNALITDEMILLHTGYIQNTMPEKLARNLELLMELEASPDIKCDIALSKAECYHGLKRHEEALVCIDELMKDDNFEVFLAKSPKAPDVYKFSVAAMLALKSRFSDKEVEARIEDGVKRFPGHPEVTQLMAQYLYDRNRRPEAAEYLEKALTQDEKYRAHYINSFSGDRDQKFTALGDLYTFYRSDPGKARENYEKALKLSKYNAAALNGYLWSLASSDIQFIIRNLDRLYDRQSSDDIRMILTSGLLCGKQEVFTTYFMYFAKTWPEKLVADRTIINKVNLMKRDYDSLLESEPPFGFIGVFATDQENGQGTDGNRREALSEEERRELFLSAVTELIQAKDEPLLEKLLADERYCHESDYKDLAKIFEMNRRFKEARVYYEKAGAVKGISATEKNCMAEEAIRMNMLIIF